LIELDTEMRLV